MYKKFLNLSHFSKKNTLNGLVVTHGKVRTNRSLLVLRCSLFPHPFVFADLKVLCFSLVTVMLLLQWNRFGWLMLVFLSGGLF